MIRRQAQLTAAVSHEYDLICETNDLLRRLNESGLLAFDNPQSEQLK
jgi:hypothetical protein